MAKQKKTAPQYLALALKTLSRIEAVLAGSFFGLMALLVILDILGREIFRSGIPWSSRTAVYLMLWGSFIGVALSSARAGHLRPEIADKLWAKLFPGQWRAILGALEHLGIAIFCGWMFLLSWSYWLGTREMGDTDTVLEVPLWITQTVIPYLFFSMTLRHAAYLFFSDLRPQKEERA